MKKRFYVLPFTLFLFLLMATPAVAQESTPEIPPPLPPEPPIWNVDGLRIEYQRVEVTIEEQVATTHVEQLFVNDNDWVLEGTYLFPLPEGASVNELTMWVDGEPIEAKIMEAEEARAIYDKIVRQFRDPALLEYVGSSAIQANVFPIPAYDERRVEIEYTQVLPADNGLIHYVYPQATDLYTNLPLGSQSIRVEVISNEPIRAIYSPSHPVAVSREGEFRAVVGYEDTDVIPNQDFELFYTVTAASIGLNLLSYKAPTENGFFLLLAAPTVEVDADEIVAKDVILVLDTSGSMEGEAIVQAKEAAHYMVDNLNPEDRFNLIAFSTDVRSFQPELTPVSNVENAHAFIDRLEAMGGTNISLALLEAMQQAEPSRPLTVIFLTDGLATEGIVETPLLLDAVAEAAPESARIFAFGVGYDVDTVLLGGLAENHRGTTTYVQPGESISEIVSNFYAKVSTPVLTDVQLDIEGVIVEQLYPAELPDLFAGSQLVLAGRYREGGPATITLRGNVNGRPQEFVYEDNVFVESGGEEFIPRLWATRAIGHLLQEIRLHGENEELRQSIVNLSIRYGIITPYTSYLIEEDDIFTQTGRDNIVGQEATEGEAAPASGEAAVEEAESVRELGAAEAPAALPTAMPYSQTGGSADTSAQPPVQTVGSKTFVLRNGVWIDTMYSPEEHEPQKVRFASDIYFKVLATAPELGPYLALGPQVIVVYGDAVYEITESEEDSDVTMPSVTKETEETPSDRNETDQAPSKSRREGQGQEAEASLPYGGALILLLLTSILVMIGKRRRATN